MKTFLTPFFTNRAGFRVSEIAKPVESKVQQDKFFIQQIF
jgi:hypothetical protein